MWRLAPLLMARVGQNVLCNRAARHQCLSPGVRRYTTARDLGVLDYLLKVEEDGEKYYRNLAAATLNPRLQRIFNLLADEERKHHAAIEDICASGDSSMVCAACPA